MTAIQLALPKSLKTFVDDQAAQAGCSPSNFVRGLLKEYQKVQQLKRLHEQLMEGIEQLERGQGRVMTEADWDRLYRFVERRTKGRKR